MKTGNNASKRPLDKLIPARPDLRVVRPGVLVVNFTSVTASASKVEAFKPTDYDFFVQDFDFSIGVNSGGLPGNLITGAPASESLYAGPIPDPVLTNANQVPFLRQLGMAMTDANGTVITPPGFVAELLRSRPGRPSLLQGVVLARNAELKVSIQPAFSIGCDVQLVLLGFHVTQA